MPPTRSLCALVLFYAAAIATLHHLYLTHPTFDPAILTQIHTHATPTLTLVAKILSFLGSPRTLWPAVLLVGAILWRSHLRPQAIFLLSTMAASGLLESLVKLAVRRPRSTFAWTYVHETTYSFPSGHATLALALYGTVVYLTRHRPAPQRLAVAATAVAMTFAIGLSRLYLGAHYPTDVLAGYLTGATALLLTILSTAPPDKPDHDTGTAEPAKQ